MTVDDKLNTASEAIRAARRRSDLALRPPTNHKRTGGPIRAGLTAALVLLLGMPFLFRSDETTRSITAAPSPGVTQEDQLARAASPEGFPYLTLATDSWHLEAAQSLVDANSGEVVAIQMQYVGPEVGVWLVVITGAFEDGLELRGVVDDAFIGRFASLPLVVASAELLASADQGDPISGDGFDGILYFVPTDQSAEVLGVNLDIHAVKWDPTPGYQALLVGPSDGNTLIDVATQAQSVAPGTWSDIAALANQTTTTIASPSE